MRNKLLIVIIAFAILALAALIYYGAQSLSPRAYVAPGPEAVPTEPSSTTAAITEAPARRPAEPSEPRSPEPAIPTADPRPATDAEAKAYAASSTPRVASASALPTNLLDTTAFQYGKSSAIIAERPSGLVPASIWKFDLAAKTISTLIDRKKGATYASSPLGKYILLSYLDDTGALSLFFETVATKERRPLRFATLPAKCAVRDDRPVVYCGVPQAIPSDTILPDDYLKRKTHTNDRIMMVDFEKLEVRQLWGGNDPEAADVFMPIVMGKSLLFTNRLDGSVWTLPL